MVLLRGCAQDFWKGKVQLCGKYKPSMSTSHGYLVQRKIWLAGHWFTVDPNTASMHLPPHFGDVAVSSNGIFWKLFSALLFMLTFWIIKLSTLKSELLWTSVRMDQMTSRGPFQLRVFPEFRIQRLFTYFWWCLFCKDPFQTRLKSCAPFCNPFFSSSTN